MGVLLWACTVGEGSGQVSGVLFVDDCKGQDNLGALDEPVPFDMDPDFFAAEPLADVRPGEENNRLTIRVQSAGGRIENNDLLYFDVMNSRDVALCVRGREILGENGETTSDFDKEICAFNADTGRMRMRIGPRYFVRSFFLPRETCPRKNVVGVAIDCPESEAEPKIVGTEILRSCPRTPLSEWPSWIEFETFGGAQQNGRAPTERDHVGDGFKLDFGDTIRVSAFQITLQDDRILNGNGDRLSQVEQDIGGVLTGSFVFDYERGRAVQTFP